MPLLTYEQQTQIEQKITADGYTQELDLLAKEITKHCIDATSEANVVNVFDVQLFLFLRDHFKLDYFPEKERAVNTVRSVAKGKIDSKIGALVIEYKQPSTLRTTSDENKASEQLREYLNGLYEEHEANYIGFITDGVRGKLVEMQSGRITEGSFSTLGSFYLDTIIKSIVLLDKIALTPENLIDSFCKPSTDSLVQKIVKSLYGTLENEATGRTQMLFDEWKELFKLAHDDSSKQQAIIERKASLSRVIGHELGSNEDEYRVLYSLQTAYAILIKIIAYKVVCSAKFDDKFFMFNTYADSPDSLLMSTMQKLEDGAIFRDMGIGNLLEGDFFAWYSDTRQWNDNIAENIREIFQILGRYEDIALFGSKNKSQDLFKDLYLQIMPDKVRHSLGEFYTPSWLAEHLVSNAISNLADTDSWSGLDPCAGSGTFINVMIQKVLDSTQNIEDDEKRLHLVLDRVKGIDLNPLAVLTARINYFINVSALIARNIEMEIPVYLGDASYVPELIEVDGVEFYEYRIKTLKKELHINLPKSAVSNSEQFSRVMTKIEGYIKNMDASSISNSLLALVKTEDRNKSIVKSCIDELAEGFVELERNDWNGIWARIVANFLTTANLDKVDIVVGNPPWIDWKTLPTGYRERIKSLCVSRHLFSGDRVTGGINLNICALISNVTAQKWLKKDGVLAFLMPKPLLFQQSYEGFRNLLLDGGERMYFQEIHDWTKAGHPFKPVQQEFLSYYISYKKQDYLKGIKVVNFVKKSGVNLDSYKKATKFSEIADIFNVTHCISGQTDKNSTAFTYARDNRQLVEFETISGISTYKGREGIEFYPQELLLLEPLPDTTQDPSTLLLQNYQNKKSKHKIASEKIILEKSELHPLIKGVNVSRFHIDNPKYVVPFPYDKSNTRTPVSLKLLVEKAPLLANYLIRYKAIILAQTSYNERIIGKKDAEFYALARVGSYSFAPNHVAFRDNTKWQAAVVTENDTWHGLNMPVFQNHAASISERPDGGYISFDEAHYICAIMNAPIVQTYIRQSSDSRSFKIRPPIKIPPFTHTEIQNSLASLSKRAHENFNNKKIMEEIDAQLDTHYLSLLSS